MWARLPVQAHPHRWRQRLGDRARVRALPGHDRPRQRGAPRRPARRPPSARRAVHLLAGGDPGVDGGGARAHAAAARGDVRDGDRADGRYRSAGSGRRSTLDRADVDLADGALHVRAGQTKQREVPLHQSTTEALGEYARLRDQHSPKTNAFFVARPGRRLTRSTFHDTFPQLIRQAAWRDAASGPARAHTTSAIRRTAGLCALPGCFGWLGRFRR